MNEALRFEKVADHNNAKTLGAAMGITEDRSKAITDQLLSLMKHDHDLAEGNENHHGVDGIMALMSDFVETPQELAYSGYALGRLAEQMSTGICPFHPNGRHEEEPGDGTPSMEELVDAIIGGRRKKRHPLEDILGGGRGRSIRGGVIILGGPGNPSSLSEALSDLFRR